MTAVRFAAAVVIGTLVGALTSILQKYLDAPWASLVNAASPWLTPAFAVGALQRRPSYAAVAGFATCVFELAGYYVTAAARGYFAGGGHGILLFWTACALVGGPVFGWAGWTWWSGPARTRGLGVAIFAAAYFAEAAIGYGWRLHYTSSAILFAAIGSAAIPALTHRERLTATTLRWLLATLPAGILAELCLGLVYAQSF